MKEKEINFAQGKKFSICGKPCRCIYFKREYDNTFESKEQEGRAKKLRETGRNSVVSDRIILYNEFNK